MSVRKSLKDSSVVCKKGRDSSYIMNGKYIKLLAENKIGPYNPTELDILSKVVCCGVVPCDLISGSTKDIGGMHFTTRLCDKTLTSWMVKRRSVEDRKSVCHQLCKIVQFLHSNGIVHLDIKPDNVMIDNDIEVSLIDFGTSRDTETSLYEVLLSHRWAKTTPEFMSPEIFKSEDDTIRCGWYSDVWSLALVMITIISGGYKIFPREALQTNETVKDYLLNDFQENVSKNLKNFLDIGRVPEKEKEMLFELLHDMLSYDPLSRPTLDEICSSSIWDDNEQLEGFIVSPENNYTPIDAKEIISCFKLLPHVSVQSLFVAIDLLYRTNERDNISCAACCWIAVKSCFGFSRDDFIKITDHFSVFNRRLALKREEEIIAECRGLIISSLYKNCKDVNDVIECITNIFNNKDLYVAFTGSDKQEDETKICLVGEVL